MKMSIIPSILIEFKLRILLDRAVLTSQRIFWIFILHFRKFQFKNKLNENRGGKNNIIIFQKTKTTKTLPKCLLEASSISKDSLLASSKYPKKDSFFLSLQRDLLIREIFS